MQPWRDDGLEMYTELLHYHGPAVVPVSDTRDALMLAAEADIVVTGMNLGDPMDGVELVSRLRHNDYTRSTPIIAPTAGAWPNDRARAEGAGCDVFLPKPCLPNGLLAEVRQLLVGHAFTDGRHTARLSDSFTPHRASSNSIITLMASGSFIARYPSGTPTMFATRSNTRPGSIRPSGTSRASAHTCRRAPAPGRRW